jgi:hypothetical protein
VPKWGAATRPPKDHIRYGFAKLNLLLIQSYFINSEIKLSLRTTFTQSCLHINHVLHMVPIPYHEYYSHSICSMTLFTKKN